ncbi:MAG: stage V sporulation protein AC [Oscillospiraceae bacterium]|nr:stage V sporulation protein AC [Oscillospiraceae bacterium]
MKVSKQEYDKMTKKASPNSKSYINIPCAFAIGGAICVIGEFLNELFSFYGFGETKSAAYTSMVLVVLSAILTGLGVYERIAKHAGAGTLVPITGFANAVVSPALEFKAEGFVLGVGAKVFSIAGPVILYGVGASVIYGLIYWIMGMF